MQHVFVTLLFYLNLLKYLFFLRLIIIFSLIALQHFKISKTLVDSNIESLVIKISTSQLLNTSDLYSVMSKVPIIKIHASFIPVLGWSGIDIHARFMPVLGWSRIDIHARFIPVLGWSRIDIHARFIPVLGWSRIDRLHKKLA